MEPISLTNYYNDLKNKVSDSPVVNKFNIKPTLSGDLGPSATVWRNKAVQNCEQLKDDCRKHIILDIYAKILPLDDDYKCGHQRMLDNDVSSMLTNKGMTPTQYLTSCSEATHAPLLEYLMWATDKIGQAYMEKEDEELKKAKELGTNIPEPEKPDIEDQEVQSQLVDVKSDMDYENFVDELKKKTIEKIVADVSDLINDKKEEDHMTFDSDRSTAPTNNLGGSNDLSGMPPQQGPTDLGQAPATESVYTEAGENPGIVVRSEIPGLSSISEQNRPEVKAAARKLVTLDKAIRNVFSKNLKTAIQAENKNRHYGFQILMPSRIIVKLGTDEYMYKSSMLFSTNTRTSAKKFINALAEEYENSNERWSKKCKIWILVSYNAVNKVDPKVSDLISKITNDTLKKSLAKYINEGVIKIDKGDLSKIEKQSDKANSGIFMPGFIQTYQYKTTTYTYVYTMHLNMRYIFDNMKPQEAKQVTESIRWNDKIGLMNKPITESVISTCMDFINTRVWNEGVEFTPYQEEKLIGMAIRESTLREMDLVFNQTSRDFKEFASKIRFGHGYVINESGVKELLEEDDEPVETDTTPTTTDDE